MTDTRPGTVHAAGAVPATTPAAAARGNPYRRHKVLVIGLRLLTAAVLLGVWEWAARTRGSSLSFPPASDVAVAFAEMIVTAEVWAAAAVTLQSFVLGFGLALVTGLGIGLATARWPVLERLSAIHLRILLTAPLAPLVPLMVGIFGIGLPSRVALVFVFSLAVIALNAQAGLRHIDEDLCQMAVSFGADETTVFRRVRLPAAVPAVMAGVRLGAARAVVGMVVAELIILSVGLGQLIDVYRGRFRAAEMYATVIIILLLGITVLRAVRLAERRLTAWKR